MSEDESEFEVRLTQIEGYSFKIDFGLNGVAPLIGDEEPNSQVLSHNRVIFFPPFLL